MPQNWRLLGSFYTNDDVAELLNAVGIGVGAIVSLDAPGKQFVVWGDEGSQSHPGYAWQAIFEGPESGLAPAANEHQAISATATANSNKVWVLWGYCPE